MFQHRRKNMHITILTGFLILAAYACRMASTEDGLIWDLLTALRSVIYIGLFSAWAISVHRRIIQVQPRRHLVFAALMMVFWILVRAIKFSLAKDPGLIHWLWYLYYLPLIFIPLLSLYTSQSICRSEDFRISRKMILLYLPATILLLLVLTNDLHQLVFVFAPDGPKYPMDGYGYGIVYYMIVGWILLCFVFTIGSVFVRNRMTDRKRRIVIPAAILLLMGFYGFLYFVKQPFIRYWLSDMTIVFCLCLVAFYDSLFWLNLIQSNTQYSDLFLYSAVPAVIVDEDYKELISTRSYANISVPVMQKSEKAPIVMKNGIRLSSAPIRNGYVLWQEDISQLVKLNRQLESTRVNIEEQNAAELEAYQAERQRHQLEEKNRLYDKMQKETRGKVEYLSKLLEELEKTDIPEEEKLLLLRISVIGAYIKRRSNLSFLSKDWKQFPVRVLKNCIRQSLDCLTLFGVEAEQDFCLKKDMPIESIIRLYDVFEEIVEYALDTISELFLTVTEKENGAFMTLRLCTEADFTAFVAEGVSVQEEGGGEWLLTCFVMNGGEAG